MKIRIKFKKYGSMKFIGHLDIMRYFQKAIRRAGIPIAYSEGFSPHQVMSFAAPLGVGLESNGEYMDVELKENDLSGQNILTALNRVMVEGIEIISVRRLPDQVGNAMASVAAAEYTVRFRENQMPEFDWSGQLEKFCQKVTMMVNKQTKKSIKEMDIKPYIFSLYAQEDGIRMLVDASSAGNIKPSLVMEAFFRENGVEEIPPFSMLITREETYGNKGTGEETILVPLEEFGETF